VDDVLLQQGDGPDPARVATQQDFGRELTLLRLRAGLTIRGVARAAGIPASTAGDYFSGRHLPPPTQPGLLAKILAACGETDPARARAWAGALTRARRSPGPRPATVRAPYRGLASFQPEDAPWFFGREAMAGQLAALAGGCSGAAGAAAGPAGLPLAVVGPSGSGKSSLLRAGLIPRLLAGPPGAGPRQQPASRPLALVTPSATPLAELAAQLSPLTANAAAARPASEIEDLLRREPAGLARLLPASPGGGLVLVVDQLEAVFTDCADEAERQAFIGALAPLAAAGTVVLALRADFYGHALRYPLLASALQERQVVVPPMTQEEVRAAITGPARLAKLEVEPGLVEVLLRDLAPGTSGSPPGAAHEPGALPLLSHALLATWEHSRGGSLTVADYQASGGIKDAIARTAEAAYAALAEDQQAIARRLFLRLVHVADDAPATRSTVPLTELREWPGSGPAAEEVLDRFVAERLITVDADTAQLAHDTLLTAWPRLRAWIEAGRDDLRTGRRISDAARAWADAGRDSAALLRGGQLAIARDWLAGQANQASLGKLASEFVAASSAQEKLQQQAERNRTRRLHRLVAALTALVLATLGLTGYAFAERQAATAARDSATAARDNASSREVAIEANQTRGQRPGLAAQLSLAAYQIARTPEARASLLESSGTAAEARLTDSAGVVQAVSLSPGHRLLAVAGADGTLRLWDVALPGRPHPLGRPLLGRSSQPLYAAAFSPDGRILAAAGAGRQIWLWDVSRPGHPARVGPPLTGPANTVYSVAFSPDGGVLAAGSADGTVRLWDLATPARPRPLATVKAAGYVQSVTFSPDGKLLAAGCTDNTVRLWNVADPARPAAVGKPLTGPARVVYSVAFSPDGKLLAAGCTDNTVRLWNVADPARPAAVGKPLTGPARVVYSVAFSPDSKLLAAGSQDRKVWLWQVGPAGRAAPAGTLTGATDWVNAVSFSPDGTSLAAGTSGDAAVVWNVASRAVTAVLPHPQPVTSLAWDGGTRLITGNADGVVRTWTLPSPTLLAGGPVDGVAFGPHGELAVAAQNLQLWNAATRTLVAATPPVAGPVSTVAVAPDGREVAAAYGDGTIRLWRTGPVLAPLGPPVRVTANGLVESVAFSPDGRLLATGGDDGTARLYAVTAGAPPRLLATLHDSVNIVFTVAFSPDGKVLAVASGDNLTRLWDIADPARPTLLGHPLGGLGSYAVSAAFSPDGHTLAIGSADRTIHLWDVRRPAGPRPLGRPLTGPAGYVYCVQFSPDGKTLAAAVTDGTVWMWRVGHPARATLSATLTGPIGHVFSVAFGLGGTTLAAGSTDGTVRLWDVRPAVVSRALCADAGQPLTRAEWAAYVPGLPFRPTCPGR
jgi:WD40 repeat protein/transcriptional regulator with XRE-family HTH domain